MTVVGRDEGRGAAAAKEIDGRFLRADLSVLGEVRALAARLAEEGAVARLTARTLAIALR